MPKRIENNTLIFAEVLIDGNDSQKLDYDVFGDGITATKFWVQEQDEDNSVNYAHRLLVNGEEKTVLVRTHVNSSRTFVHGEADAVVMLLESA